MPSILLVLSACLVNTSLYEQRQRELRDDDGDGYNDVDGDCDDADPTIHPSADEVPYDDVDQDCDGFDLVDADGDGHDAIQVGGNDCDDDDASVNPDAPELWSNDGVDNDCDGDRYDVVRWTTDQAPFRLDGAVAGGELGRRIGFWEEGGCLLAAAPYADEARGTLYAVDSLGSTMVAGESGGTVWGDAKGAELSPALSVSPDGRVVVSQISDTGGAGTVFLLDAAELCAGGSGAVDSVAKLTIEGDTPLSWFGDEARWLDDVNGDGIEELAVDAISYPGGGANRGAIFVWYDPPSDGASISVDSADVVLYGADDNAYLSTIVTAADDSGSGAPWLLVSGKTATAGSAVLYRIDGTELVTGSVADVSDGGLVTWTTDQWCSLYEVGDVDFSKSDDIAAGVRVWGLWDVADLEGFQAESDAYRQLTFDVDGEWMTGMAPVGDYDGDGRDDFAMLAEDWPAFTERGQLALAPGERANAGNLDFTTMPLFAEGAEAGDSFAYRVDRTGDLDHDGHDELIVAAPGADNNGANSGSIYLLPLP